MMFKGVRQLCLGLVCTLGATQLLAEAPTRAPKMVVGWLESVQLLPADMRIKAKLDTGAKTSSLHAKNIEYFKKDGKTWVRFDFTDTNLDTKKKETHRLEGPLTREVVIKRHGAKNITRPVVAMNFCLYHQVYRTEFSLANRSKFNYSVLLGRSFLSKVALVDSSEIFLSRPACEGNNFIQDALE
ncbi:ATP-dependent zinc protease [Simiduia sp. 21SJ11W-1]|uniref:ATP-dependent zinc protease family protein n=1 Tax=Simiduia sp. 21SJ11W-1 TaxID=2909669 RepID=UPI00209E28FC|nr:ATP-dependent zinc protease [Simiduia sp. 21SJ11W-1]UTA46472.1 ATP-dependent zinc protease [Simiduia sp. 21SJ11W-1]